MKTRVLVVSNNPMSTTRNNGKTIESIICNYKNIEVSQLYFCKTIPDSDVCDNFFSISEADLLKLKQNSEDTSIANTQRNITKSETMRLIREVLWATLHWKTEELTKWLDKVNPEVIFFVGGDSLFAYRITTFIKNVYHAKTVVYITDDYFMNLYTFNLSYIARMFFTKIAFKKAIKEAQLLLTIGDEMSRQYKAKWDVDSYPIMNMPSLSSFTREDEIQQNVLTINYFGGLELGRWEVLSKLGEVIDNLNESKFKISFKIFSPYVHDETILRKLTFKNGNGYAGSLNREEVVRGIVNSDIVVHAESFKQKYIKKTMLSISTKISEYQALEKCILAIGPATIASMKYLSKNNGCIMLNTIEFDGVKEKLLDILNNRANLSQYGKRAYGNYLDLKKQYNISIEKLGDSFHK